MHTFLQHVGSSRYELCPRIACFCSFASQNTIAFHTISALRETRETSQGINEFMNEKWEARQNLTGHKPFFIWMVLLHE